MIYLLNMAIFHGYNQRVPIKHLENLWSSAAVIRSCWVLRYAEICVGFGAVVRQILTQKKAGFRRWI
jgi:hypothetical protein